MTNPIRRVQGPRTLAKPKAAEEEQAEAAEEAKVAKVAPDAAGALETAAAARVRARKPTPAPRETSMETRGLARSLQTDLVRYVRVLHSPSTGRGVGYYSGRVFEGS